MLTKISLQGIVDGLPKHAKYAGMIWFHQNNQSESWQGNLRKLILRATLCCLRDKPRQPLMHPLVVFLLT